MFDDYRCEWKCCSICKFSFTNCTILERKGQPEDTFKHFNLDQRGR